MLVEESSVYIVVMAYSAVLAVTSYLQQAVYPLFSSTGREWSSKSNNGRKLMFRHLNDYYYFQITGLFLRIAQETKLTKYSANMQQANATTTYCYSVWLSLVLKYELWKKTRVQTAAVWFTQTRCYKIQPRKFSLLVFILAFLHFNVFSSAEVA